MAKAFRARGMRGFVVRGFFTGNVTIRLKTGRGPEDYIDCSLAHADLEVVVVDDDAWVYPTERGAVLDYSTKTITGGTNPPKQIGKEPSNNKEANMAATKKTATKKPATKRTTAARKGSAKASRTTKNRR